MLFNQAHPFNLNPDEIYLCNHSLGPMTIGAQRKIQEALLMWDKIGVRAWDQADWINLAQKKIAPRIAHLIGAMLDEVSVGDSTSINLYKVIKSALQLNAKRQLIITEADNFPSDLYVMEGIQAFHPDLRIEYKKIDELMDALTEEVAILVLSSVNYRSGALHAIAALTQKAHEQGILVVFDICHHVGAIPLTLHLDHVDFAVGCTYKYLNGGPGSPGFCYIHRQHHALVHSPLLGWMGHSHPFEFNPRYQKGTGVQQYQIGTPNILSLKALEGALDIFDCLALTTLREHSQRYSQLLIEQIAHHAPELVLVSPINPQRRGNHVSFQHLQAAQLNQDMISQGLIGDYRPPQLLRFSVNPLYHTEENMRTVAETIGRLLRSKNHENRA